MDFIKLTDCIKAEIVGIENNNYIVDIIAWGIFNQDIPPFIKENNIYKLPATFEANIGQFIYMSRLSGVDIEIHNE